MIIPASKVKEYLLHRAFNYIDVVQGDVMCRYIRRLKPQRAYTSNELDRLLNHLIAVISDRWQRRYYSD